MTTQKKLRHFLHLIFNKSLIIFQFSNKMIFIVALASIQIFFCENVFRKNYPPQYWNSKLVQTFHTFINQNIQRMGQHQQAMHPKCLHAHFSQETLSQFLFILWLDYNDLDLQPVIGFKLIIELIGIIIRKIMNKQNMNNPHPSIFQTITPQLSAQLQAHSQWLESVCFLNKLNGPEISLSLSNNHLIIFTYKNRTRQHLYQAQLSFDTKFEIIYQLDGHSPPEEAVYSKPIGFRITKDNTHKVEIYPKCKSITPLWIKHLSRCINQQGFHRHFKLIKKVGKGGFANVYEVKRVTDKKHFAVKAFSKQTTLLSTDIQTKLNLLNEITMLRTFDSPHLIKCEAVYQSENSIYIVLQLLSHGQLHDRINKTQAIFSLSETRQFVKGMALGLKQMHEHRVMHRDIKPENIMLRGNEGVVPVICDFGLSSNVDESDYLFYKCGTPGYVAPEITTISKGQHIEPQCDIFSLGCILHLMLVQRPLFQGKKASQVYQNNRKLKIDWSSQVYKKVDNEALDLLRRMLKIDPTDRIKASEILNHPFLANLIEEQLKQPESARTESSAKSIV